MALHCFCLVLHLLGGPRDLNNVPQAGIHVTTQAGHGLQFEDIGYGLPMRALCGHALVHVGHDALSKYNCASDCARPASSMPPLRAADAQALAKA